jgi:6-methylsalicylate decarboxylase
VTFTVDIHHHMLPDFFWQATNEGNHPVGGITPPPWSCASTLSFLDDAGIDVAITSISTPGVHTRPERATNPADCSRYENHKRKEPRCGE